MYQLELDHVIKGQRCKLNTENWEGGAYGRKEANSTLNLSDCRLEIDSQAITKSKCHT